MNNAQLKEDFGDMLSTIGTALKQKAFEKAGFGVFNTDYEENMDRIVNFIENIDMMKETNNKLSNTVGVYIDDLRKDGYDGDLLGKTLDLLDKIQFNVLGKESSTTIKIKKYIPQIGANFKDTEIASKTGGFFDRLFARVSSIMSMTVNSSAYSNAVSLSNNAAGFDKAWKNVIDSRMDAQDVYDFMRIMAVIIVYCNKQLDDVLKPYAGAAHEIGQMRNVQNLIKTIPSELNMDFTDSRLLIARLDQNREFNAGGLKNSLVNALKGNYTVTNGLEWATTTEENVKIMAWMILQR